MRWLFVMILYELSPCVKKVGWQEVNIVGKLHFQNMKFTCIVFTTQGPFSCSQSGLKQYLNLVTNPPLFPHILAFVIDSYIVNTESMVNQTNDEIYARMREINIDARQASQPGPDD
jgi:hypothetical protein